MQDRLSEKSYGAWSHNEAYKTRQNHVVHKDRQFLRFAGKWFLLQEAIIPGWQVFAEYPSEYHLKVLR